MTKRFTSEAEARADVERFCAHLSAETGVPLNSEEVWEILLTRMVTKPWETDND